MAIIRNGILGLQNHLLSRNSSIQRNSILKPHLINYNIPSTMYGGRLSARSLAVIQDQDTLIAAFGPSLYLFSLQEGTIRALESAHSAPILHIYFNSDSSTLTTIDSLASVASFSLTEGLLMRKKQKMMQVVQNKKLQDARISDDLDGQLQFFCLQEGGRIIRHSDGSNHNLAQNCQKILFLSEDYLAFLSESSKITLVSLQDSTQFHQTYMHNCQVTSAEIFERNLLIGDFKGKITTLSGFLDGEVQLKQKLQWHVHQVSALCIRGTYLYSAGQEGTVVLWHLRQNNKDFLPRLGAGINNIFLHGSKIFCLLSDNSIKAVDLAQDKAVISYRVLVNPQTNTEKQTDSLVRVSELGDKIFMKGQAGRIQQINLTTGLNRQHCILDRNYISRLDNSLPCPHQLSDISFNKDGSSMVSAIEGINCRNLSFFVFDQGQYQLVSRVENCHSGKEKVQILRLGQKFVSFSRGDPSVKVWKLQSRRKQSVLEVEEHFWACEFELVHRGQFPQFISLSGHHLSITYQHEFLLFNTKSNEVDFTFKMDLAKGKQSKLNKIYKLNPETNQFIAITSDGLLQLNLSKKHKIRQLASLPSGYTHSAFNSNITSLAVLSQTKQKTAIFLYSKGKKVQILQISESGPSITDIFWLSNKLVVLDSSLCFHDLTSQRSIVSLSPTSREPLSLMEMETEESTEDFSSLQQKYMARQTRKAESGIEKAKETLKLTPSICQTQAYLTTLLLI